MTFLSTKSTTMKQLFRLRNVINHHGNANYSKWSPIYPYLHVCCHPSRKLSNSRLVPPYILQKYERPRNRLEKGVHTDIFSKSLEQSKALEDILVDLESKSSSSLEPAVITSTFKSIHDTFYESLDIIPWLQRNNDIAFIQLLLSRQLIPQSQIIWEHPGMGVLMEAAFNQCDSMTNHELTQSLLKLLYLGFKYRPEHEKVLIKMYLESSDRIPSTDLLDLSVLTGIHARMFMQDWRSISMELKRFTELMQDPNLETPEMALNTGRIILSWIALPLADNQKQINVPTMRLLKRIEEGDCLDDPDHISMYLRLARKLFLFTQGDQLNARYLISLTSDACIQHIDKFGDHNIAEACAALRQSRCFNKELMSIFSHRSVELLQDDNKLSQVSNLFYAIGRHATFAVKKKFENALFQRLQEVDVVLLSNLAENFVAVNINNEDLVKLMHEHIALHADALADYNTRFNKVVRLLLRRPFTDPEHESKFTKSVMVAFEKQIKMSNLAMFCVYLLPASRAALDEDVYQRIQKSIPKLKTFDHHRMALAINQIRNPSTAYRKQSATLQSILHEWIMIKSDEIQTLDYLFQLSIELVINSRKRDPTLTTHFMEMFPKFTKNLTDVGLSKVLNVYAELHYYMPEVYDDLTAFALSNDIEIEKLTFLLLSLARVGYTPKRFDELVEKVLEAFDEYGAIGQQRNQILLMKDLNILNVYPEDKLNAIFSIDFIEKLDGYLESNPRSRYEIENVMLSLNRNVVLECPQLDIPWFHEQFMINQLKPESDHVSFALKFKDEVEKVLLDPELLDSKENLRRWIHSPYGYTINFEFILNDNKEPVSVEAFDGVALPSDMQRVAVLAMTERAYTYNQRRLVGKELLKWRHLEILGYKVVHVPYFEWYSMGLSDYIAKVEYLSSKIFDS